MKELWQAMFHPHGARALESFGVLCRSRSFFSAVADEEWWITGTRALLESVVGRRNAHVGEPTHFRFTTDIEGSNASKLVQGRYAHGGAP